MFLFIWDQGNNFVRTALQAMLAGFLPEFVVFISETGWLRLSGLIKEFACAFSKLNVGFSLNYFTSVLSRGCCVTCEICRLSVPSYTVMFSEAPSQDLLRRVIRICV